MGRTKPQAGSVVSCGMEMFGVLFGGWPVSGPRCTLENPKSLFLKDDGGHW